MCNLFECNFCKTQYVGNSETPFTIRLNNHKKDVNDHNAIPVDTYFTLTGHNFNNNSKCYTVIPTLSEMLTNNKQVTKENLMEKLKNRGKFWMEKLKTDKAQSRAQIIPDMQFLMFKYSFGTA